MLNWLPKSLQEMDEREDRGYRSWE
jgi:hypothetical protein